MGQSKQLLPLDGKPIIRHCIEAILASGIGDIIVVLGQDSEQLQKVLADLPVRISHNSNPASDMAESVRTGLLGLGAEVSGVLVSLSDHPLVSADTLKTLITIHCQEPDKIVIPVFQGKHGHPTLFPIQVLHEILKGGILRDVVKKDPERIRLAEVMDEGVILDIDTREDYERAVKKSKVEDRRKIVRRKK
jgi:molybdenum cofactor cytidylyltransferase